MTIRHVETEETTRIGKYFGGRGRENVCSYLCVPVLERINRIRHTELISILNDPRRKSRCPPPKGTLFSFPLRQGSRFSVGKNTKVTYQPRDQSLFIVFAINNSTWSSAEKRIATFFLFDSFKHFYLFAPSPSPFTHPSRHSMMESHCLHLN